MSSLLAQAQRFLPEGVLHQDLPSRPVQYTAIAALVLFGWVLYQVLTPPASQYPAINDDKAWFSLRAKAEYFKNAKQLLADGSKKFTGPYNLVTDSGNVLMMPPELIDAINAESKLTFNAYVTSHNCADLETFRTFREPPPGLFNEAVLKGLTRSLPKFTKGLSKEMEASLEESWGNSTEWRESDIKEDILQWVARLSSHIFLGPRFSSNKEWLRIAISFTVDVMIASTICRFMPWPLRWPVERLLPLCRRVRRDYRACAKMLAPVLKERYDEIAAAEREGRQPNLPDDSIEWFRNAAHGRHYEETDLQIALQLAAIHTTSDLLCQTILDICVNTDLIQPLREEAVEVLSKYGWKKLALTELRLLDSVFKESQRLKPIAMASMHREAIADVDLGNGIKIRKGESIGVSAHQMWEEDHYEEPEKYDGFRFVKRRKIAGLENRSLLVATSNDHLGFSHGKHACPGRFFAANEVKIALVHLLLKYDMKLADPSMAKPKAYGVNQVTNPAARIQFRRRTPEIDIDNLAFD